MRTCPSCGRENEKTSLFCRHCGTRLAESPARREQRKTVTILVCDLVHSTGLAEGDPEAFRRVQSSYFDRMRGIVERHGGTVEKFVGDEVMAVFGVPTVHEDDALRAVRAADEMQRELSALSDELDASLGFRLRARVGINTGEVLAGDPEEGHGFVAGEAVIVAKRLQQAAEADTILIGDATYALVEHAVDASSPERIAVKGKQDAVGARILRAVRTGAPGVARRLHTPMVGRDSELAQLQGAFERTIAENSCRLATVVGPAGIGKSRLATEFFSWIEGRAVVATGRCLSYGEGITLWPLSEILRDLGGETSLREALDDDDARDAILQALRGATGTGEARAMEETFWAVRRAFQALARRGPLVVCFEDLHWAEPAMLDLVEYVVAWSREVPILVLALGRPELAELRPQWIAPRPDGDALTLQPLSSEAAESLLVDASKESLAPETRRRIVSAAEGNPLFVEQMGAMVAEQGGKVPIPPSIQALLTERLDRLGPDEREVIERASIVGRDFPVEAVAALMPDERRGLVTPHLFALVRKGLMRPEPSTASEEDRFGFQHALVREAAYDGMSKEFRAALHERFADWLEKPDRGQELDEVVGYHLERAHLNRLDVGVVDEHTHEIAARAGELLAAAGSRALGRNDVHAAQNLLARAIGLLPDGEPAVERKIDLCLALFLSGDFDAAAAAARDTAAHAIEAGDEVGELRARIMLARIAAQQGEDVGDEEPSAALLEVAEEARPVFAQAGNELALAEAWFATAWAQLIRCQWAAMLDAVLQALAHARNAGSARWEGELPAWLGTAMFYGPTPVDQALRWFEDQQAQHPIPLTQQAMLEAMRGNFDVARTIARAADTAAIEFGQQLWLPAAAQAMWQVETLAGDVTAAEVAARRSCELLEALGDVGYRGVAISQLAWSLCSLGRFDEAIELTQTAEAVSASDDVAAQMLWRQARGRILARRGEHEKAERLASEAVALAEDTDMVNSHADALVDSAEISALAGRRDDACLQLGQALALYEQKGNLVAAASARRELERLARAPRLGDLRPGRC
jgi:class 3 adenylate cyclase/tetratricopeptide (TPR) repeat protein